MAETMGQIIRRLRKERNFTQDELAEQLNISAQAISKWENNSSMPDISQIVPLASVFNVNTDVLFGVAGTSSTTEAWKIVTEASSMEEYGKLDSYLAAYDMMLEGLKKYPNNLILLNNCVGLGLSLALPENGWIYAADRAGEIAAETMRQANLIIAYSKNASDIMRAHEVLVYLYSSEGSFDKAIAEAQNFPVCPSFTLFSNLATVYEHMKNDERVIHCLCSDIDYSLQQLEYNAARLGKAYFNSGNYRDAIAVYETFFGIMKAIFKEECPPPYHDFDSGDCYLLLAQAYLAVGETERAMDSVEQSVSYFLNLIKNHKEDKIPWKTLRNSPLVKEAEVPAFIDQSVLKEKLLEKLASPEIQPLKENPRYKGLCQKVIN